MLQQFKKSFGVIVLTALCCWPIFNPVQSKILTTVDPQVVQAINVNPDGVAAHVSNRLLLHIAGDSIENRNKVLAAILSFPLPFGMLGLHRIYLGAKPIIPILYVVTLGGFVGILPFVDMMVIILSEETKSFIKNSKILMWYGKNQRVKSTPP